MFDTRAFGSGGVSERDGRLCRLGDVRRWACRDWE